MESKARGGKIVQSIPDLDRLYQQATQTFPEYKEAMESFLNDLRAENPGQFRTVEFKLGDLKEQESIAPKVNSDYKGNAGEVLDIVRGTFISDNAQDLPKIQDALEEKFSVVRVKDKVFSPTETGLRNYHSNMAMPNGHIVETQVMPSQLWEIKAKSHALMKEGQKLERAFSDADTLPPETRAAIVKIDKENRVLQNAAVHETGLNNFLNPDFTHQERAKFTVPFELNKEFNATVEPMAHLDYNFNKASSPFLHKGMISGVVIAGGVAAYNLTQGATPAQAAGDFYENAVPYGEAQTDLAQGNLKSATRSAAVETVSNIAFSVCAIPGAVGGGTLGSAVPVVGTALGAGTGAFVTGTPCVIGAGMATEFAIDTAPVVAHAAVDVVSVGAQKSVEGANYLASYAIASADNVYNYLSGNMAQMNEVYDALPVLDSAANDDLYDPSIADPIQNYPVAHDLAQIKTQIVTTQDMIGQINDRTKEPFNGMNKTESTDFLQERVTRLNDRFESNFEQAKADGSLNEVNDYTAQYGIQTAQPALAIQTSEPAANQSWDSPKTRALAM